MLSTAAAAASPTENAALPMAEDASVRICSMIKLLTSVVVMMLYEAGHFQLDDPITRFLQCFRKQQVLIGGRGGKVVTVPAIRDATFRDLLARSCILHPSAT